MAPIALRLTMKKVRMTDEEARRMLLEQLRGVFDPQKVRVLFPSSGGPNSPAAALFVSGLTSRSMNPVELLSVQAPARLADAILSLFRRNPDNRELEAHLASLRELLAGGQQPSLRKLTHRSAAQAILIRAQDSFDLIALGASQRGHVLGGPLLEDVVEAAPCHVVIVKSGSAQQASAPFRRLLVPYDGGVFARVAVELAVRYAEATSAEMTIAVLAERPNERPAQPDAQAPIAVVNALAPTEIRPLAEGGTTPTAEGTAAPADEEELGRISNLFRVSEIRPRLLRLGRAR
jgi:nucleotide-binding universal stress UspA family protein